jgi:hypothetical protein
MARIVFLRKRTVFVAPQFDYERQAWTVLRNGRRVYVRCGHPESMDCGCYGRAHAGETVEPERLAALARCEA